jgi:BolA protein
MANGQLQPEIIRKLREAIHFESLDVINESHMHSVPPNSETHFKVVAVADAFDGKRMVARHQTLYRLLAEELAGEVHALALHLYTPSEWLQKQAVPASPVCMGGSKQSE